MFRLDGDTRTASFAGTTVLLRDLKGMQYLARLLAEPGREFHVLDLVTAPPGAAVDPGQVSGDGLRVGTDDAGPLLDDQARQAYRRRLTEVDEDIAEAEEMGDQERRRWPGPTGTTWWPSWRERSASVAGAGSPPPPPSAPAAASPGPSATRWTGRGAPSGPGRLISSARSAPAPTAPTNPTRGHPSRGRSDTRETRSEAGRRHEMAGAQSERDLAPSTTRGAATTPRGVQMVPPRRSLQIEPVS